MYQTHFHFALSKLRPVLRKIFLPLSDFTGFLAIEVPVRRIISTFAKLQLLPTGPQHLTVICLEPPEAWALAKPHCAHVEEELEVPVLRLEKNSPTKAFVTSMAAWKGWLVQLRNAKKLMHREGE